jgi:hypothetical protein
VTTENWTFETLVSEYDYEKVREEWFVYCAKSDLLHEMQMELRSKKDYDSETWKFVDNKLDIIREQREKFYTIQKYLLNLTKGFPFHVSYRVGRYMIKFGLTEEQSELFLSVHKSHLAAMGIESQMKYKLPYVQKVVWDQEKDCLKVYYDDVWWHYLKEGTWY